MALHLLRLPGEIRNKIYEYALIETEGVCYREGNGVGWLCIYHAADDGESEWETDKEEDSDDKRHTRDARTIVGDDLTCDTDDEWDADSHDGGQEVDDKVKAGADHTQALSDEVEELHTHSRIAIDHGRYTIAN
ncbi:hypothetical protein EK21DRAFT_118304 [Setomelanomma holmii]|uniref:Uncharacterized protein n=1 Tax=Setomelanomma holmii TaxID=210430 RepID=A0A9P4GYN7_9PLEO|nr:hypothetical protein EK21DRAFT_118304 [Setomelanomma holmii]